MRDGTPSVILRSELSLVLKGPFSVNNPSRDEAPGPPFNHNITGSYPDPPHFFNDHPGKIYYRGYSYRCGIVLGCDKPVVQEAIGDRQIAYTTPPTKYGVCPLRLLKLFGHLSTAERGVAQPSLEVS